jgi:hypothetical protein
MDNTAIIDENFFNNLTPEQAQNEIKELLEMKKNHPEYNYYFKNKDVN